MKKSVYVRSTKACKFLDLRDEFIHHLEIYKERNIINDFEQGPHIYFQTKNIKKGFFGCAKITYTFICITDRFLFWGTSKNNKETTISAAQWIEIDEIRDWESSILGRFSKDHGVLAFGFTFLTSQKGQWFMGLGNDEDGNKCIKLLKEFALGLS